MINNIILIDEKIKKKIHTEISFVPEDMQQLIIETVNKLPKKQKPKMKLRYGVAAILIALVSLTTIGITNPTYAKNIPVVGQLFKVINNFLLFNYDNFSSNVNTSKESNGYKITLSKTVYDGIYLTLAYKIESDKPINFNPNDIGLSAKLLMNNDESFSFNTVAQYVKFSNDKKSFIATSDILMDQLLNHNRIPNKFDLEIDIVKILGSISSLNQGTKNEICGNWNFNTHIISEKVKGNVKQVNCSINLDKIEKGLEINKLILTPLNSILYCPITNNSYKISYIIHDDKGRILPIKSQGTIGDSFFINFKEIYRDSKKLTFVPYNNTEQDKSLPKIISTNLNLKGKTIISLGKYGSLLITNIKTENGVTKLYYKSYYGSLVIPFVIKNKKTGEVIYMTNNAYDGNSSGECVVTFNKAIGNGDCIIVCQGNYKIYTDMKFNINIK